MIEMPSGDAELSFIGGGGNIQAHWTAPKGESKNLSALVCHPHPLGGGTMDNKVVTTLTRNFRDAGIGCLRLNFRGVGHSEGGFDFGVGESEDVMILLHWLRRQNPGHKILLAGFSFGSFVSLRAANLLPKEIVERILLIAPPVLRFNFRAIGAPVHPLTIIQPQQDEVVSPPAVEAWVSELQGDKQFIKAEACGHFFHGQLSLLKDLVNQNFVG